MFRKYLVPSFIFLLVTGIAATIALKTLNIKNSVDMRNGPGSYYKLLLRLQPGSEVEQLEREQQWLKVKTPKEVGWIPERSVYTQKQKKEPDDNGSLKETAENAFDELSDKKNDTASDPYASRAQVAAAVKGFAQSFTSQKTTAQEENLLKNFDSYVDKAAYKQFRNQRLDNWSWAKAQSRLAIDPGKAPALNPQREQAGWGIANVIAQRGLLKDKALQQYLTHIALVIAENSHRYETTVQVYILETNKITGFAAPNGSIFVSKGALQLMKNEAGFAYFVAHELAHIVFNHGAKETEKREPKIRAEEGFEELNEETGQNRDQKYIETEAELTKWANQVYEYTIKDRLNEYEYEADYWGLAYTYRAGYDAYQGLELLKRIYDRQGDFDRGIGLVKWEGTSLRKRITKVKKHLQDFNISSGFGNQHTSTFQQMVRDI
ncbi:M48 family metalloprotease [Fodinibius saliphilus]|uniref:M48 family metalloprotease n=1 Tax=Fodinibius saliphilus TaxID=1920650 RepID=UPI0014875056|nr:M48 family metalloprotease [Fodinibius saliphilus]